MGLNSQLTTNKDRNEPVNLLKIKRDIVIKRIACVLCKESFDKGHLTVVGRGGALDARAVSK